jgi:ADP-heptose:LPS heptosyltransferase
LKLSDPSSLLPGLPHGAEILIVRLRSLGDLVLETPAIAALAEWRSDLKLRVLAESWCAPVLEGNPDIAGVIVPDQFLKTARALRQKNFAIAFNQHGGPRSALLTASSGAPARVCWSDHQFSTLYNIHVPEAKDFFGMPVVHTVEHRISQFYWCGLPREPIPHAKIFPQPDAVAFVAGFLEARGIASQEPYAILEPGARIESMRWPTEKFGKIARWLGDSRGIQCVVNLKPGNDHFTREQRSELEKHAVIADCFDVRQLIALCANARIFVGNDSGPAHLAAAAGRPCVVIFGSTNPAQWSPWQTPHRIVHTGAEFHSPRGDKSILIRQTKPIAAISEDQVREACEELLSG